MKITKTKIRLKKSIDESYDIVFGNGMFSFIASDLKKNNFGNKYAIITDSNVKRLYGLNFLSILNNYGLSCDVFSFPAGEKSKNISTCMRIIDEMLEKNYGRDTVIIAFGGGVVGDLAGFIASIFNRGVSFIQVPTTVLSQADSSIGGKTGVDNKYGKNLIGCFKQPRKVYVDISLLRSLPEKEIKNGLSETIKHAIIFDARFFTYLEKNINKLLKKDIDELLFIAKTNSKIKCYVVEHDCHENGLRKILNYGHTIGHAIEKLSKYKISHGEGVSIGMMVAGRIAVELNLFSNSDLFRQEKLIKKSGLPIRIPIYIKDEDIVKLIILDKKSKNARAQYVLPVSIGKMHMFNGSYSTTVNEEIVLKALLQSR